jgi:hypothetical protein
MLNNSHSWTHPHLSSRISQTILRNNSITIHNQHNLAYSRRTTIRVLILTIFGMSHVYLKVRFVQLSIQLDKTDFEMSM